MNRIIPMSNAEFLKLRKRRGLFWFSLFLTAGMVVVANVLMSAFHASNPVKWPPAGGHGGFTSTLQLFNITVSLAAVLVGATAGAQDFGSGVFRSLVSTGQSRIKLALVRIPGALLMLIPMVALGFGLEVVAAYTLADGTATPDLGLVLNGAGWLAAVAILNLTVGLGLSALLQARGMAIGIFIAWQLAASRALERVSALGGTRGLISSVATDRFIPGATDTVQLSRGLECTSPTSCITIVDSITISLALAAAVVVAWIVVATVLGVWRTATQDA